MKVNDYLKRVQFSNNMSEGKSVGTVEELYWKSLSFNPPLYGADVKGSLCEGDYSWNLNNLKGILSNGLDSAKISGINEPYFYFGAWKTTFAWHCEDLNLPSINYLHYGKPK